MSWRLARSLEVLRDEVNAAWPNRSKASDGTIGDQAHSNRTSDHNPNSAGVVTAFDITAPVGHEVMELIRKSRDPRVKYMISNSRICSSYSHKDGPAWSWRPYSGSNPHTKHAHISVVGNSSLYDDRSPWLKEASMSTDHKHDLTSMPSWGQKLWDRFVKDGVTNAPDSWKRVAHRLDLAWIYTEVIVPIKNTASQALQAASSNTKSIASLTERVKRLEDSGGSGGSPNVVPDHVHAADGTTGGVKR